jgi:hypothetical protein
LAIYYFSHKSFKNTSFIIAMSRGDIINQRQYIKYKAIQIPNDCYANCMRSVEVRL